MATKSLKVEAAAQGAKTAWKALDAGADRAHSLYALIFDVSRGDPLDAARIADEARVVYAAIGRGLTTLENALTAVGVDVYQNVAENPVKSKKARRTQKRVKK